MKFTQGLLLARSQIVFLVGLVVAFGIVVSLERWEPERRSGLHGDVGSLLHLEDRANIPTPAPVSLTSQEQAWARTAWQYFANNTQPETGLVNSVDGYPASTMWDTASYLLALIAVDRLNIISDQEFDSRLSLALSSLAKIPLFEQALPNKSYNTISLAMVDYANQKVEGGIGWSAIDIGRLLVPFNTIVWYYPKHAHLVRNVLERWRFQKMLQNAVLYGAAVNGGGEAVYVQEGRIGYEEYAAKSFTLLGLDTFGALQYNDFLQYVDIYGIQVPIDSRKPEEYEAHNYVVSESYILDGIEYGWDDISREFAYRVYQAQHQRYKQTGIPTAVSEDNIDQPPYFVYNTVFTDGKAWNCITEAGEDASEFKTLSTKAVFGWYALYRTPYTKMLLDTVADLHDPQKGWYSGLYEKTGLPNTALTGNTNAIILEALHYKQFGKYLQLQNQR